MSARKKVLADHAPPKEGFVLTEDEVAQLCCFLEMDPPDVNWIIQSREIFPQTKTLKKTMHLTPQFFEQTTDATEIETIVPGQDLGIVVVAPPEDMQRVATVVAERVGWARISRLTLMEISNVDHGLIEHQRQIRDMLPWVPQQIYRTQRPVKVHPNVGSMAQEDKFLYVVDTAAEYADIAKGTDFGLLRLMAPGKSPTVKEVKEIEIKDGWAITVHKDLLGDLYAVMGKKKTELVAKLGPVRGETRTLFPRIPDCEVQKVIDRFIGTPYFSVIPLAIKDGSVFKEDVKILEVFMSNKDGLAGREAPYAWATLMRALTEAAIEAHVEPRGKNKLRIGFAKADGFLLFMDRLFGQLKEKGFSFKYEKSGEWVSEEDDFDSDSSTSTTLAGNTIFLCDTQPWYTVLEIKERVEDIVGQEVRMTTSQFNVGDPDKNAWRIRGDDLSQWAGSYLKEANGKYFGQLLGFEEYTAARAEHLKQKQSYSSAAASATAPQARPPDRKDMQLDVQAARGSKRSRE